MPHLGTLKGHLLQPSASWKKALQRTEPSSSSSLSSWLPLLVHAQKPQAILPLAQNVQAGPGLVHSVLVVAQSVLGVHDVLHGVHLRAQIFQCAYAQIFQFFQIWTLFSWMW